MPFRERWIVVAIVTTMVVARSAVFLVSPEAYFDSDQAIVGLMAKHLSEFRAFPVFYYGQTYMLGVEAWLAAPLFVLFGASPGVLKVPLLAMNLVIALLLVRTFQREMRLTPLQSFAVSLPFILPPVGLSAVFTESNGGNLEPYLYVVLLWVARKRPWLMGLVFGIGFLNREFTIYGLAAMALLEAADRTLFTRVGATRWARVLGMAAIVWIAVQGLARLSSASGPGTTIHDTLTASNNLAELAARTCISPATTIVGARRLLMLHWPAILGTAPYPLTAFSIESRGSQGLSGSSWLPAAVVVLSVAGIAIGKRARGDAPPPRFAQYLVLTGVFSVAGYLFGRCGEVNFYSMRYELLSLLAIVGLCGWFVAARPAMPLRAAWSVIFAAWMLVIAVPQIRFGLEYATRPPVPAKHQLIRTLEVQGIRFGRADYWLAYYIDFLTRERMVFASDDPQRVLLYNRIVAEHANEAVRLSRRPCDGGTVLVPGVYRCR